MVKTKKKAIWITLILFIVLWTIYFLNRDFFQLDTLFSNLENIQSNAPPGERKLFLFIEAESQAAVKAARKELKRIVQEASMAAAPDDSSTNRYAKYTV